MSSKLGEILVRKGYISEGQLADALARQRQDGGLLGSILVDMGFTDGEQIRRVLTRKYGGVSIGLSDVDIDPELAAVISEQTARRYTVVPVARARGRIAVAMADPTNVAIADELRFVTGYAIEAMLASESEVRQKIDAFYRTTDPAGVAASTDPAGVPAPNVPEEAHEALRRAGLLTESAKTLIDEKVYQLAVDALEQAVFICADALGPHHLEVAKARTRLGYAYTLQESYEAAERVLNEALVSFEVQFGDDHIDMAKTLNNLGLVLYHKGQYGEARSCFERALAVERDALSAGNPETGITALNLAYTYNRQQRFADAEPWFALSVELLSAASDPEHPALADAKASLAACRWTQRALRVSDEGSMPRARDV